MDATPLLVPIEPQSLGEPAVTTLLNISRTRAYALMNSGALKSVKVGRRRLIVRSSLDEYVQSLLDDAHQGAA